MSGGSRLFRGLKSFSLGFFVGVPICLTFTDNFCTICQVEGVSMQPVLNHDTRRKDFVLISRWKAKQFHKIERGDIVSIMSPKDPNTVFIKRIIALEGDNIRALSFKHGDVKVPCGHCWIEGDNHKHSLDSNSFGSVPLGLVNGVATRIVWPPSSWGKLSTQIPVGRNPYIHKENSFVDNKRNIRTNDPLCINISTSDPGISFESLPTNNNENDTSRKLRTCLPKHSLRHASDMAATSEE